MSEHDQYVLFVFNKYHVNKPVDAQTHKVVITPLHEVIKQWARNSLNGVEFSGSRAKGTATRLSYDFDLFISLKHETENTLKKICESLFNFLQQRGIEEGMVEIACRDGCLA